MANRKKKRNTGAFQPRLGIRFPPSESFHCARLLPRAAILRLEPLLTPAWAARACAVPLGRGRCRNDVEGDSMTTLLVNRNCMESLREDITDLQGTVVSVFSRAGAVRYPSWKFPDKVSCDLDLVSLLEHYDFVANDPEFTQHSHVVLLELVIDRLLLLLQSFTGYTENLINDETVSPSKATGPCMSIGLAVKKYWNSMLKLGALYQELLAEKKCNQGACTPEASRAENECSKSWSSESYMTLPSFQSSPLTLSAFSHAGRATVAPFRAKSAQAAAKEFKNSHAQTIESSLIPCDACERAQASLREVGKAIISICKSQNLPSSLSKFLDLVEETIGQKPLTAVDIGYWAAEQSKDLSRINKHLQTLMGFINPLKEELKEIEKQKETLKKQLQTFDSCLQEEKEGLERQRKEAERLFEKKTAETRQLVSALRQDKENLQKRAEHFEEKISTLTEALQQQQAAIQELERSKKELLAEMRAKMVDKGDAARLEERVALLSGQLQSAEQQLQSASTELNKEKAKVESILRHKEALQAKQATLVQHLDSLHQECEQLKTSLAEGEDSECLAKEELQQTQAEKREVQRRLEAQQELTQRAEEEKLSLEQSVSALQKTVSELSKLVQEHKEREKLLVSFPDLHMPVEAQFESTGNIIEDMEKQLQANNIRISVLEEENSRLRTNVAKLKEAERLGVLKLVPPTQLWNPSVAKGSYENSRVEQPPAGQFPVASLQGAALGPPKPGSPLRNGSWNSHPPGSSVSQRTPSSHLAKPPTANLAHKPAVSYSFLSEGAASSNYTRAKGRGKAPAPLFPCPRKHRK
ncbi:hypothetical protein lerEdw1_019338 [Lerista edwardsae]|nr:hypothetical protein lerEdw1_019338 [Lerista edwardsae]